MFIRYGYEITFQCNVDTPIIARLNVHPDRARDVVFDRPFASDQVTQSSVFIDPYGNLSRRFLARAGVTTIVGEGIVNDAGRPDPFVPQANEWPIQDLPPEVLPYLLGSRYCETDLLSPLAWQLFGTIAPGWNRVQAICDYVHNQIAFNYQFARNTRTALEAQHERVGVCRDYAHLAIAFCRCLNIPARYVNGFLGDIGVPADPAPMDFSAWIEVYLGGQWHTFDARHNVPRIGRIVIARGRDAMDVPVLHSFGTHALQRFKVVTEEAILGTQYAMPPGHRLAPVSMRAA